MTPSRRVRDSGLGPARPGLLVLAVAVFAAVTTELLPVGLLPQISAAFEVSSGSTGLLVSAYAAMVAVLSVPLALATGWLPRKPLLLSTLGGYVLSNVIAAAAPTFDVLAAGRVIGGITHALFFSVCIGYSARLVPPTQTGRAMALVAVGISGGLIFGVPLSTALGTAFGWRAATWSLALLAALVLLLAAAVLPAVDGPHVDAPLRHGRRRDLATVAAANGLCYLGTYVLYTYISLLLLRSGTGERWVGPILLLFGACGLLGLRIAAAELDARPRASAILVPALMAVSLVAVAWAYPRLGPVIVTAMVWRGAFGPAASLYQSASIRTAASSPEIAGAWINASSNAGIGGGAALGAVILDYAGLEGVAWTSAALTAGAAALAVAARSAFPARHGPAEPDSLTSTEHTREGG